MSEMKLGLFNGEDKPTVEVAWDFYEKGLQFNNAINLDETVRVNENFFVGRQWEGVNANGLPTPVFNILKRVVGFIIATITTDNLKVNAVALANSLGTESYEECVRVVNEELEAHMEHNDIPALVREFARDAAVRGDGCIYTYWDPTVNMGGGVMGMVKHRVLENNRVFFGNPNDKDVQSQPFIQISNREIVRNARIRAKRAGSKDWEEILPDDEGTEGVQDQHKTDDKCTVILTMWKDEETGEVMAYESTHNVEIRKPWSLGIRKYPITWMSWDFVQDSYHGQAMITGLIPNQIFINKAYAMSMLSMMRTAWPKIVYDNTRVAKWDNRVGGAIGVTGDVTTVAKILDPAQISPQIAQFIQMAIEETEESLGATASALGEGKAYNTSAILSLQRAAATPSEMIKQNLYRCVEDLFYIVKEFMGEYFGIRKVDTPTPPEVQQAYEFVGQSAPDEVPMDFDFSVLKEQPFLLKLDVGASSYYSEIAAMQTLDNLLQMGQITVTDYLERVPDSYVPGRRKLIDEIRKREQQMMMQQQMAMMGMPPGMMPPMPEASQPPQAGLSGGGGGGSLEGPVSAQLNTDPEITGGRGYRAAARQINGGA